MADISMCVGVPGVDLCDRCYRKRAVPNPRWQSYVAPEYNGECENFIEDVQPIGQKGGKDD